MSTDIATRQQHIATLPEKIEYARFLAKSGLLPKDYREHPENILFAYEYGELLGLHPMAAITGIHVIEGKPSISAGLMSALVRQAGHRIRVEGNDQRARCQIIRSDDPGFTYSATWDMDRAKQAGLLARSNWQRYPAAMLKARAVSEAARDACQEVLLGMAYTPDELGADDDSGEIIHDGFPAGPDGRLEQHEMSEEEKEAAGLMTRGQRVEHDALRRDGQPPAGAVQVTAEPDEHDPWTQPDPTAPAAGSGPSTGSSTAPAAGSPSPTRGTEQPGKPKGQPAPAAAVKRMEDLIAQIGLGPPEHVDDLIRWLCPGYTATRAEVKHVTEHLAGWLEATHGDIEAAADGIWSQMRRALGETGGDGDE